MSSNLIFDFEVNKENNTIVVKREFAATQELVWEVFTKKELLDEWWAPAPWKSKTSFMNFRVNDKRIYAMCGPEGEEHWAVQIFTSISPINNFQFEDAFCDKDGNINSDLPSMKWSLDFSNNGSVTLVEIHIHLKSLEQLELIISMGFKEGFTQTLNSLETLFINLKAI